MSLPFWYVYNYIGQKVGFDVQDYSEFSEIMGRAPMWFAGPGEGRFASGLFQKQFEEASQDRFPLLLDIIKIIHPAERRFNKIILSILPEHWTPVLPVGGDIVSPPQEERLVNLPLLYSPQKGSLLEKRAQYYQDIAEENPSALFFIVAIKSIGDCVASSNQYWRINKTLARDRYCKLFDSLIGSDIKFTWIGRDFPAKEAIKMFYKTDHHFSMPGAYKAYCQILSILSDNEGLSPVEPRAWFTLPKVFFRGAYARRAGGFFDYYDKLEDANWKLPIYNIKVYGEKSDNRNGKINYLKGSIQSGEFVNHYAQYFGKDKGLIQYNSRSSKSRNLLVVSDSFSNCIEPLLASHYNKTFFIDPRYYKRDTGKGLDISKFIKGHDIDDVLFFGDQTWILGLLELKEL